MSRWWILTSLLLLIIIAPFLVWGEMFDSTGYAGTLEWLKNQGSWAWLVGIGLLCADILLPVPGTVVMSALGYMYGWMLGGVISAGGSFLSGMIAYTACRVAGRPVAVWIAGESSLSEGEGWFAKQSAGWLVALSRWTPVLPEAIACLAGLALMPLRRFTLALACGSIPLGFAFAAIGALGTSHSGAALTLSAVLPVLLYAVAAWIMRRQRRSD